MNTKERSVLIIGGAGYIGSVLTRELLSSGYKVRVLDNLLYNNGAALHGVIDNPDFTFIKGDLCNNDDLYSSLEGATDVVLLAALVGDPISKKYPELSKKVNEDGAIKVIDTINHKYISRFIFLSTCSNYGLREDDSLATEESELKPLSIYANNKVAIEKHILGIHDKLSYCPTILRCATAFGDSYRMRFDLTVSEFCREFALDRDFLVYDENTWRPYCHVLDISRAIIKVMEAPEEKVKGEVFNIGNDSGNYTKKMIVEEIQKHLPNAKVKYKEGGFDPRNYRVSFDKITNVLGFQSRYSVAANIPKIINAVNDGFYSDYEARKNFYGNYYIDEKFVS